MARKNNEILFRKKILNLLSFDESSLFDKLISEDSDFREEYLSYKEMMEVLIMVENDNLKARLKSVNKSDKKRYRFWLPIAASFCLLIGVASYFYFNEKKDLYSLYIDKYPNLMLPTTRGDNKGENELRKTFFYYEQGDYDKAIIGFESQSKNSGDINILFYKAMSYLQMGKLKEAEKVLITLPLDNKNFHYSGETRWYLALLKIRENRQNIAIKLLMVNVQNDIIFKSKETKDLLEVLKEIK